MPRKPKANTDFNAYENGDLSHEAHLIATSLLTNIVLYSAPPIAAAALKTLADTFDTDRFKPIYPSQTADVATDRKALIVALSKDGNYVNTVANGDLAKLALSGYPLAKEPAPHGILQQTAMLIESLDAGFGVQITPTDETDEHKVILGARNYMVACIEVVAGVAIDPDPSTWPTFYFPKSTGTITGLKPSTKYMLASTGCGTFPKLVWSFPITRTTQ